MKAVVKTALTCDPKTGRLVFAGPQKVVDRIKQVYGDQLDYVVNGEIEYDD